MSLTSYQAAPPRVLIMAETVRNQTENDFARQRFRKSRMAPAVGFEPTTNRLTADRSTTELRWIVSAKKIGGIYLAHSLSAGKRQSVNPDYSRALPLSYAGSAN